LTNSLEDFRRIGRSLTATGERSHGANDEGQGDRVFSHFAQYQDEAMRTKVIIVTSHERVVGGYPSADELAHYERPKSREREVLNVGELSDDVVADIEAAEYGVEDVTK
jgi:hypothetical protein